MQAKTYNSPGEVPKNPSSIYYHSNYLSSQPYQRFIAFNDDPFFIALDQVDENAISIPRSPFGAISVKNNSRKADVFIQEVKQHLRSEGIQALIIHQPSPIYEAFVSTSDLLKAGFEIEYSDINQHIELSSHWEDTLHKMQQRKLEALKKEGFEFKPMKSQDLKIAYDFLSMCRQAQGLSLNISWDHLDLLNTTLPDHYECFGVFRKSKISAVCIAVRVTSEIAYYYLPGTSPLFRTQSPMVMLIAGMVDYYRKNGFKFLDMGVSSIKGKPQETLRLFKERMGAQETAKPTLKCAT